MTKSAHRRFWCRVEKNKGECWTWTRAHNGKGYGVVYWNGRLVTTHRLSWEMHNGPIPHGMCVCHRCDNPPCVRPDHLFLGTVQENNEDRERKGRGYRPPRQVQCKRGHSLADHNRIVHGGISRCRECVRQRYQREKGAASAA